MAKNTVVLGCGAEVVQQAVEGQCQQRQRGQLMLPKVEFIYEQFDCIQCG